MSGATVMAPRTSAGLSKKSGGKLTSGMANGKGGPPSKQHSFVSSNKLCGITGYCLFDTVLVTRSCPHDTHHVIHGVGADLAGFPTSWASLWVPLFSLWFLVTVLTSKGAFWHLFGWILAGIGGSRKLLQGVALWCFFSKCHLLWEGAGYSPGRVQKITDRNTCATAYTNNLYPWLMAMAKLNKLVICHLHFTQADQISPKSKADPLPWWLKAD